MDVMFPRVNHDAMRLLVLAGCEVAVPRNQACCGALHAHAGLRHTAKRLARENVAMFEVLRLRGHRFRRLRRGAARGRPLAARTTARRRRPRASPRACATSRSARGAGAAGRTRPLARGTTPRARSASAITTLVISRTRRRCGASRASCCARSRASSWWTFRTPIGAAAVRASTTSRTPTWPTRSCATSSTRSRRWRPRWSWRRIPAASCTWRAAPASGSSASPIVHLVEVLARASSGAGGGRMPDSLPVARGRGAVPRAPASRETAIEEAHRRHPHAVRGGRRRRPARLHQRRRSRALPHAVEPLRCRTIAARSIAWSTSSGCCSSTGRTPRASSPDASPRVAARDARLPRRVTRGWSSWLKKNRGVLAPVEAEIRERGPLGNADFEGRASRGKVGLVELEALAPTRSTFCG